jgi:hypothetical protein
MKLNILFLVAFASFVLPVSSCKKNNTTSSNSLPPATETGANTFGCLINGQAFTPGGGDGLEGGNLDAINQYAYYTPGITNPTGYVFAVNAVNERSSTNITSIGFRFDSVTMQQGMTYTFQQIKAGQGGAQYSYLSPTVDNTFNTSSLVTGQLSLTRFDLTAQIASGTFWFNVLDNNGDTIKITNGRFDVTFTQ